MPPNPLSAADVLDLLCEQLAPFLDDKCVSQYGTAVSFESRVLNSAGTACTLQFKMPNDWQPEAKIRVRHVGGNMYDVWIQVVHREPIRLIRSVPEGTTARTTLGKRLGETVGQCVLDELEHALGQRILHAHRSDASWTAQEQKESVWDPVAS